MAPGLKILNERQLYVPLENVKAPVETIISERETVLNA